MNVLTMTKRLLTVISVAIGGLVLIYGVIIMIALYWTEVTHMGDAIFTDQQVAVSFWTEKDFDSGPNVYYKVMEHQTLVVPQTYLGHHRESDPFPIRQYSTSNGTLLAVSINLSYGNTGIVIYDTVSRESWPRLRSDEVSYKPEVKNKWRARYLRIKAEYPDISEESYFTENVSQQSL